MTINVAVITSEAIVLGCDSIASTTKHLLDPFSLKMKSGKDDKQTVEFEFSDLTPYVTGAWGGVTKMFPIHSSPTPIAAITAGLAKLNDRTMSSYANEFLTSQDSRATPRVSANVIANEFLKFLRKEYERHYSIIKLPPELWDEVEFLVGGYGGRDNFPSLFRVKVKENTCTPVHTGGKCGTAWAGQSDAVQRLIFGYDVPLKYEMEKTISKSFEDAHASMSAAVARILQEVLDSLGETLPKGIDTSLPDINTCSLPWDDFGLGIECANLPLQDAVDFAAYLVNMQSGKAKFVYGVPTVGGRTHIGIITKADGFKMLNEPRLEHRNVGFIHDV